MQIKLSIKEEIKYLDKENDIVDFGTGKILVSGDIFDSKTHVPFYDQLFSNPKYMADKYNLKGEIVMMSPTQYYKDCADKIFDNSSVESLKASRRASKQVLNNIRDIIFKYRTKVFLPYINYAEKKQEGLHRMMVAGDEFGWDTKFPVLVINWVDEDRAKEDADNKVKEEFNRKISNAIQKALKYYYKDFDEFKDELIDWELDRELQYMDGYPFDVDLYMDGRDAVVEIKDITKYKFNPNAINYKKNNETEIDEDELDKLFIDDIDLQL